MTDKQLKSLSKTQLFSLLHKQELEIERLGAENVKLSDRALSLEQAGSLAEASIIVSGIIEAAQSAADIYLDSMQTVEADRLETISKLEEEAKARAIRTAEIKNAEAKARLDRLVKDLLQVFNHQLDTFATLKDELTELIKRNDLNYLLSANNRTDEQ